MYVPGETLAESLERWHDVERTMVLNYYSPLRLIRGIAPAMLQRGDGHIINVATWGVFASVGFYAVSAFVASAEAKQFCVDRCVAFEGAFERFENEDCCSFAENYAITSFVVWT